MNGFEISSATGTPVAYLTSEPSTIMIDPIVVFIIAALLLLGDAAVSLRKPERRALRHMSSSLKRAGR